MRMKYDSLKTNTIRENMSYNQKKSYYPFVRELLVYGLVIGLYMFAFYGCSKLSNHIDNHSKLEDKIEDGHKDNRNLR